MECIELVKINKKSLKNSVKLSQSRNSGLASFTLAPMFLKCMLKETSGDAENRTACRPQDRVGKTKIY